jgi:hypothetical protein
MKKELLVIFETQHKAVWYIEDKILPFLSDTKKKDPSTFEGANYNIRALSFREEQLRGRRADFIFLSDDCTYKIYSELVIGLVNGDHNKIQVVM